MKVKLFLMFFVCLALLSGCAEREVEVQKPAYKSMNIKFESAVVSDKYPATVQGRHDVSVFPQVSGTISKVCISEGQKVLKGQSLFVIDQVPFKAALQMATADVEAAKAAVETAKLVYESRKTLYNEKVVSEFDLKTSKNALASAEANLEQAKAREVTARNNLKYTMVESPVDGVVGTIPFREGNLVSPQMPSALTTVSDNSQVYVYFSVSENKYLDLISGYGSVDSALVKMPDVSLIMSNNSQYSEHGRVETISGVIDSNTGSVSFRAVFPNAGGILRSGASATAVIARTIDSCAIIPVLATFEMQDQVMAYKYVDGKTSSVNLSVVMADDANHYIVTSGLQEGDVLVTEGVSMLHDAAEISVKEAE